MRRWDTRRTGGSAASGLDARLQMVVSRESNREGWKGIILCGIQSITGSKLVPQPVMGQACSVLLFLFQRNRSACAVGDERRYPDAFAHPLKMGYLCAASALPDHWTGWHNGQNATFSLGWIASLLYSTFFGLAN